MEKTRDSKKQEIQKEKKIKTKEKMERFSFKSLPCLPMACTLWLNSCALLKYRELEHISHLHNFLFPFQGTILVKSIKEKFISYLTK